MHTKNSLSEQFLQNKSTLLTNDKRLSALNSDQLQTFFSKKLSNPKMDIAISLTQNVQSRVSKALSNGSMNINNTQRSHSEFGMITLNNKKNQLQKQLHMLKHLMKSQKFKPLKSVQTSQFTEQQHLKIIKRIKKDKKKTDEKRIQYVNQLQRKRYEQEVNEINQKIITKEKVNQQKRARISLNMKNRQESNIIFKEKIDRNKSTSRKKLLYRELQSKYINEVVLPAIEQKNNKLQQIKGLKRPIRIEQIKKHEEQYLKRKQTFVSRTLDKKQQSPKYSPSFKSSRHEKMRKQQQQQKKRKEQQKKIQKQARVEKIQSFKKYLSENFKPVISETKRKQLQEKIQKQNNKARQISSDVFQMGREYLQYSKSKGKKTQNPQSSTTPSQVWDSNSKNRPISNKPNYIRTNIKQLPNRIDQIDNLIKSSNLSKDQKLYELRQQSKRLNSEIEQKQKLAKIKELREKNDSSDLLLASIKARMGMLQIYNN